MEQTFTYYEPETLGRSQKFTEVQREDKYELSYTALLSLKK